VGGVGDNNWFQVSKSFTFVSLKKFNNLIKTFVHVLLRDLFGALFSFCFIFFFLLVLIF